MAVPFLSCLYVLFLPAPSRERGPEGGHLLRRDSRVVLTLRRRGTTSCSPPSSPTARWSSRSCFPRTATTWRPAGDDGRGFAKWRRRRPRPGRDQLRLSRSRRLPAGIIGDLGNLPASGAAWRSGRCSSSASRSRLHQQRREPVRPREAIAGLLPWVNACSSRRQPEALPRPVRRDLRDRLRRRHRAGWAALDRDNSAAGEIWLLRNKVDPRANVEESVSIRAIRRVYAERAGIALEAAPEPRDIFAIGRGERPGDQQAAARPSGGWARLRVTRSPAPRRSSTPGGDRGGLTGAAELFLPRSSPR